MTRWCFLTLSVWQELLKGDLGERVSIQGCVEGWGPGMNSQVHVANCSHGGVWGPLEWGSRAIRGGAVRESAYPKPLPLPLQELLMAKAWPQAEGFTFFSSLVTKAQMTPLSPPDLELGARLQVKNYLVFGGYG